MSHPWELEDTSSMLELLLDSEDTSSMLELLLDSEDSPLTLELLLTDELDSSETSIDELDSTDVSFAPLLLSSPQAMKVTRAEQSKSLLSIICL